MIEIIVPGFVAIKMDRISTEERYPSFGINIGIELITFSGKKEIQLNSVWFEQKSWDEFISRLGNFENSGSAILSDMSDDLKIKITREEKSIYFYLSGNEKFTNGEFGFQYKRSIDRDDLEVIAAAFRRF